MSFRCSTCGKDRPDDEGAADDQPDVCDGCYVLPESQRDHRARLEDFTEVLGAIETRKMPRAVELVEYTSTGAVVLRMRRGGRVLYRADSLEAFMVQVAEAYGWKGTIA